MVTGRSVSRTIRDWVVVRKRRRMQDHHCLQTSTLSNHPNDHPNVPTPQSVCWRLRLPASQLGLQHPRSVRAWTPGQHPTTLDCCTVQPKGNSQFLLSPLERQHQPRLGPREFRPGQPTAGKMCSRKVPAVTTSALPHNATKIQGSCPQRSGEALELLQGRLEVLLPSHRWIRREIATFGHTRYWEGTPGLLRERTFCG